MRNKVSFCWICYAFLANAVSGLRPLGTEFEIELKLELESITRKGKDLPHYMPTLGQTVSGFVVERFLMALLGRDKDSSKYTHTHTTALLLRTF